MTSCEERRSTACRQSMLSIAVATLPTTLAVAMIAGSAEFSLNLLSTRLTHAPIIHVLGSFARVILIHAAAWIALGLVLVLLVRACFLIGAFQRVFRTPEIAVHVGLISAVVFLISLADLPRNMRLTCFPITVALGGLTFLVLRWQAPKVQFQACKRVVRWSSAPCILLIALAWITLQRSPAAGPTVYRVPPVQDSRRTDHRASPNVIFVMLDTVRADRLSTYGYGKPTTPFLEKLATEATLFEMAVSPGVWTVPAHASLFTGLSVREHKANWDQRWLADHFVTLAELLSERGYETVSLSNNVHLRVTNLLQGFQYRYSMWSLAKLPITFLDNYLRWVGVAPPLGFLETDDGAAATNCCIADWLDHVRTPDRPFFMFINYMEAHVLYWPPREYRRAFMDDRAVERSYDLLAERRDLHTVVTRELNLLGRDVLGKGDRRILRDLYDASIRYQDDRVEELYDLLDQRGLLADTLFVVVSDHGESLGEHDHWDHQWSVHNTLLHVPLLVRHPPTFGAQRVARPVLTSDLFATVAEMCDLPVEAGTYRRWVKLESDAVPEEDRPVVSEYLAPYHSALRWAERNVRNFDAPRFSRSFRSVIMDNEKLILGSDKSAALFDLAEDPFEIKSLAEERPGSYKMLALSLAEWLARTPEYIPPADGEEEQLDGDDRDVIEALRSLGYVGD